MNAKWMLPVVLVVGIVGAAVAGERSNGRLVDEQGRARLTLQQAATIGETHGKGRAVEAELDDGGRVWEVTVATADGRRPRKLVLDAFGGRILDEKPR